MTSYVRRCLRLVRGYVVLWIVAGLIVLAFIGSLRVIGVDDAMNWSLFVALMSPVTLGCLLGVIYRFPARDDRS